MKELVFDDGRVEYTVNNKAKIRFNPTDEAFVERLFTSFEDLDKRQEEYREKVQRMQDKKEIFKFCREFDKEMRGIIDGIFESDVSDNIFGTMNVYSLADGLPIWANFILAVIDEINGSFDSAKKLTNEKLRKYTDKYRK